MASAAAILDLFDHPRRAQRIVQVFGTVGRVGEVTAGRMVESSASRIADMAMAAGASTVEVPVSGGSGGTVTSCGRPSWSEDGQSRFIRSVAPMKAGVMPLLKNKPELVKKAQEVRDVLRPHMNVFYDDAGSIGRRYARQDEAGTPLCITVDGDTIKDGTVTLRDRDTLKQERIPKGEVRARIEALLRPGA